MAKCTDPRFAASLRAPSRGKASAEARRYAARGADAGATAASKRAHALSDKKMDYRHPVLTRKEPTARG
jgi:hypothetical protein